MVFYDDVKPINIPPKAVIKLDLHNGSWNKGGELDYIWRTKKEDYENYFINHKLEEKENGQAQNADS